MVLVCLKWIESREGPGRSTVRVHSGSSKDQDDVTHFGTRPNGFYVSLSDSKSYGMDLTLGSGNPGGETFYLIELEAR
jgi:hypothetical protein